MEEIKAEILSLLNPFAPKSPEKIIRIIALIFTIGYIVNLINNWGLTILMIHFEKWDYSCFEYFAPIILFPIGLWGFWRMKRFGWVIITILLIYLTASNLLTVILLVKMRNNTEAYSQRLDKIFQIHDVSFYIMQLLFYGCVLFYINRVGVRDKFKISQRAQLILIGLMGIFLMLFMMPLLFK